MTITVVESQTVCDSISNTSTSAAAGTSILEKKGNVAVRASARGLRTFRHPGFDFRSPANGAAAFAATGIHGVIFRF